MNETERELVDYLHKAKEGNIGFIELRTDVSCWAVDIHLDARYDRFTPQCIFDDCSDALAQRFLQAFLTRGLDVSWSVSEQLSKLLASRGQLVSQTMESLLTTLDWSSIGDHLLFLSYLAVRNNGAALAGQLLDKVPEDGRDGLFLACYRLRSEELDRNLIRKFLEWDSRDWSPGSTGEIYALEQFIAKWLELYPFKDLESVIRMYFKRRFEHRR